MDKTQAKAETLDMVVNGPRKVNMREIRAASSTILTKTSKGKRRRSRSLPMKREGSQESQTSRYATSTMRHNARTNPHVIFATHQNAPTTSLIELCDLLLLYLQLLLLVLLNAVL